MTTALTAPGQDVHQRPSSTREHLTADTTRAVLRIQQRILASTRELLTGDGFDELLPPVIGPVTDPGARGAKQVDIDFYGHRWKLMTSGILYKQASLLTFDKIFNVAPNVRLEPLETATTHRHLVEFHQIDVEIAGAGREEAMAVAEKVVSGAAAAVLEHLPAELELLGRDTDALRRTAEGAFDRIGHDEAATALHRLGHPQDDHAELDWVGEELLSRHADRGFFVLDYPKGSRGFYDREDPERPGVLRNFDLVLPEGFGEVISGSERESDYVQLLTRIRETGENPAKYKWYLDLAREGLPASAGFGIGLERLTRYIAGLDAVWQATAFPKLPGVVSP
ncbi:asparagine synthetase A [Streptomyces sp. NPDC059567]|uniref:asparagine synthetase A n=1 Tax=Streptomyces sp. NPDC059567 TaxID=3346867 RepID=UPI0036CABA3E